jgi:hypothetical protein
VTGQSTWTFLTSVTLALLTFYQVVVFAFTFYRLVEALVNNWRRIQTSTTDEGRLHLFGELGWTAAGIKLGAIETVLGFTDAGFGQDITRRVLRLLSRACLSVAVVKGYSVTSLHI